MGIVIPAIHGTKDGGTKDGGTKDGGNKGRGDGRLANHKNSAARRRLCAVLQVNPRLPRDNTDGDLDANPRRRAPLSRRARSVSIMPATPRSYERTKDGGNKVLKLTLQISNATQRISALQLRHGVCEPYEADGDRPKPGDRMTAMTSMVCPSL